MSRFCNLLWNCDCGETACVRSPASPLTSSITSGRVTGGVLWDVPGSEKWLLEIKAWDEEGRNRVGQRRKSKSGPKKSRPTWQGAKEDGQSKLSCIRLKRPGLYPSPRPGTRCPGRAWPQVMGISMAGADPEGGSCLLHVLLPGGALRRAPSESATNSFLTSVSLSLHWQNRNISSRSPTGQLYAWCIIPGMLVIIIICLDKIFTVYFLPWSTWSLNISHCGLRNKRILPNSQFAWISAPFSQCSRSHHLSGYPGWGNLC